MAIPTLSRRAESLIALAVDQHFDRISTWVLGPEFTKLQGDKYVIVTSRPAEFTLAGIYRAAAADEGVKAGVDTVSTLAKVAQGYLDAQREVTKAKVLRAVNAWMIENPNASVETVLAGELSGIMGDVKKAVVKIVDSEATVARNMGTIEGISKISQIAGVDDPSVFFVVVRDNDLCKECRRIHLMPDRVTPRVFRMSEVSAGLHDRGDDSPCVGGLHPHCRCTIANLLPGYGFDSLGRIRFVKLGHDEFSRQRGS